MKKIVFFVILTAAMTSSIVFAQAEAQKPWSYTLGLSYIGNSGNTDNQTFGTDFTFKRVPDPWGIEGGVSWMRGEQNDEKTAERITAAIKGIRKLNDRWDWFLSAGWEKDEFAGYDSRLTLATGATFKAVATSKDELLFDMGLSWTNEEYAAGDDYDYMGGLLQMRYTHNWTPTAKFQQRLLYVPNFDDGSRWRGESETAVVAALTSKLAMKASVFVRYNHEPPMDFKTTDTTTALSLVYTF